MMNAKQRKALIAGNNQGHISNDLHTQYRTCCAFFATLETDFFTNFRQTNIRKQGVNHAIR